MTETRPDDGAAPAMILFLALPYGTLLGRPPTRMANTRGS